MMTLKGLHEALQYLTQYRIPALSAMMTSLTSYVIAWAAP